MDRRITVYDVAKAIGLSPSTVSRVLNNSLLVNDDTRDLILSTARRLGYQKRVIRRHAKRSILTIQLFLPRTAHSYVHLFYDPADLIRGLVEGFADARINLVTELVGGRGSARTAKKLGDVDGAVFAFAAAEDEMYSGFEARGVPVIQINRAAADRDFVAIDNAAGMREICRHVAAERPGCRPCYIGFTQVRYINDRRRRGFEAAAAEAGLRAPGNCEVDSLGEIGPTFVERLARSGFDALICFNDVVAARVYGAAAAAGLEAPGDFALTGFDGSPILDLLPKRIDTVALSVAELGRRAGVWLRSRIIDRSTAGIRDEFAGNYVAGDTVAAERGGNT